MDILQSRDSLNGHSDHELLFFTSDEFMVELLKSPGMGKEVLEKSIFDSTNKAIDIMKAPPSPAESHDFKKKMKQMQSSLRNGAKDLRNNDRREDMEKSPSFTSKFSDGVVVKIKSPTKGNGSFRKSPLQLSSKARRKMRSANTCLDDSIRSDEGPATSAQDHGSSRSAASLPPCLLDESKRSWVSSGSEWSDDLDLSQSSTVQSKPHPPLQRMMSSVDEDEVNENNNIPPPPPQTMTSMSPYSSNSAKRGLRKSASARLESVSDAPIRSPLSKSCRTKRLSFQVDHDSIPPAPSPKQERRSSKWLMTSPSPSPHTPRSRKTSSKSERRKSRMLMGALPPMPFASNQEDETTNTAPRSPRKPPMFRPLDKTLMRDYPSSTTATTFLTADTDAIDYSMSSMFPLTKETERIIFKRVPNKRNISIEKSDGEKLGTIDFSMVNQGKRLIKDACGRTCALIFLNSDKVGGNNIFKICGNRPATRRQRLSNETGYYTWAEVRNTGSIGGKFVMNKFSSETSSCSAEQHSAKPFGSLFSRGKSRGHVFLDDKKKECVKMVSLQKGKGIIVGPNRDLCLMLAYAACVDEMVEHRLR